MSSSSAAAAAADSTDWNARWVEFSKKHVSRYTFRPDIKNPFDVPEADRDTTLVVETSLLKANAKNKTDKTFFFLCTAAESCIGEEKRRRNIPDDKIYIPRVKLQSSFGVIGSFPEWSGTGTYRFGIDPDRRQEFHPTDLLNVSIPTQHGLYINLVRFHA